MLAEEAKCIREAIDEGFSEFTSIEWRNRFGWNVRQTDTFLQYMRRHDMIEWQEGRGIHVYRLKTNFEPVQNAVVNAIGDTDGKQKPGEKLPVEEFMRRLDEYAQQSRDIGRNAVELLRKMIADGKRDFTCDEYAEELGISKKIVYGILGRFVKRGLIIGAGANANRRYCVTLRDCGAQTTDESKEILAEDETVTAAAVGGVLEEHTVEASPQMLTLLEQMASENATPRDQRIGTFLLNAIREGKTEFETSDWATAFDETESQCLEDMRKAANMGLIQRSGTGVARTRCRICFQPPLGIRSNDLSQQQKELITKIYDACGKNGFRLTEIAEQLNISSKTVSYHIGNLRERGILAAEHLNRNSFDYALRVTPGSHPECFVPEEEIPEAPSNNTEPAAVLSAVAG